MQKDGILYGFISISEIFFLLLLCNNILTRIIQAISNVYNITLTYIFQKTFSVVVKDRNEKTSLVGNSGQTKVWYTDAPKIDHRAGIGVKRSELEDTISPNLGKESTEIIYMDNETIFKALQTVEMHSKLTLP